MKNKLMNNNLKPSDSVHRIENQPWPCTISIELQFSLECKLVACLKLSMLCGPSYRINQVIVATVARNKNAWNTIKKSIQPLERVITIPNIPHWNCLLLALCRDIKSSHHGAIFGFYEKCFWLFSKVRLQ